MSPLAKPLEDLVAEIRAALDHVGTLNAALAAVAAKLSERFPIARVSVRVLVEPEMLEIVGVWSVRESLLKPGTRIPVRSSSLAEQSLRVGRALIFSVPEHERLLDQILLDEGIHSWATVALRDAGGSIAGLLSISSDRPAAFVDAHAPLFETLGRALEEKLLGLARGSGTL